MIFVSVCRCEVIKSDKKIKFIRPVANENKSGIVPTKKGAYAMTSRMLFGLLCCLTLIACDSQTKTPEKNTINPEIEQIVQKELKDAVATYQARGATGIIMEAKTGRIISMVSVGKAEPMRYVYEMGSVFKIFNTALAYENGLDTKEYQIDKTLGIHDKYGKKLFYDVPSFKQNMQKQGITKMTASDILLYSCNVGSASIALDLPDGAQKEFFHKLHFDERLDLDFGKTEKGLMPRSWGPVDRATVSFGYGIAVTPMHLFYALGLIVVACFFIAIWKTITGN